MPLPPSGPPPAATLELHGCPAVTWHDGRTCVLSLREAALLAWLQREGPTPRSRLAGLLWPDGTEAQARANLRQALARFRRAVGPVVEDTAGLLQLAPSIAWRPPDEAGLLLGTFAPDALPEFAQWLARQREADDRDAERRVADRGRQCLDQGDPAGALAAADALLARQPENETGWRLRMEALYLQGDRAGAVAAWDACRDALRQGFGIAPSEATNALGRLILQSETVPAASGPALHALPAALRRPPQLVGRGPLGDALAQHLAMNRSAGLTGPGGAGKSRLLRHVVPDARAVAWAGARPGDAAVAGGLIGELLRVALALADVDLDSATVEDLGRWLHAGAADPAPTARALPVTLARQRSIDAVVRALAACHAAGVRLLVVDDLHFADAASLEVLHQVLGRQLDAGTEGQREAVAPPPLLLAARADELPPAGQALLATLASHLHGRVFELPPLSADQVGQLLATLPLPAASEPRAVAERDRALADGLHAAVGGNPAHLLEALRHMAQTPTQDPAAPSALVRWQPGHPLQLPASLIESVRHRVQRLPAEALHLAQLAAVAQADFDLDMAEAVTGRPALEMVPHLAALDSAWVFDGVRFSHDLVASAVRSLVPRAVARLLHRRVADHLIARHADAARIAQHLLGAEETGAAAPWLERAAAAAQARWQLPEAAAAWTQAAQGFDQTGRPRDAFRGWCAALRCWVELRRFDAAEEALKHATAAAVTPAERSRVRASEVLHLFNSRRLGEGVRAAQHLSEDLAACLEALPVDELVYTLRAVGLAVQGGLPASEVLRLCDRMAPAVTAHGIEARAALALARGGMLLWDGQPLQAAAVLDPAWTALAPPGDPFLRRAVGNQLMRVRQALGDLEGAMALGDALLDPATGQVDASFEADVLSLLSLMRVVSGRVVEGMAGTVRLRQCLQRAGEPMRDLYAITIALCCLQVGRTDEALDWLDRHTRPPGRDGYALYDFALLVVRARLARARGGSIGPYVDAIQRVGPLSAGGQLHRQVALAALQPGPLPQLEGLADAVRARGQRSLLRTVHIAAARAAAAAMQCERAVAHARAALELAPHVDAWSDDAASAWWHGHAVLAACGEPEAARQALAEGLRWVRHGAAGLSDPAGRRAWCEGHPMHRQLLGLAT